FIDYDGDGVLDVLVSNGENGILLFRNEGAGRPLRDVSAAAGLGRGGPGAGNGDHLSIADYDGDGFTDFLYNLGSGLLFRNNGDGTFAHDRAGGVRYAATGGDLGDDVKMGTAFGDYDNDGDPDLFVPQSGSNKLFRNNGDGTFSEVTRESGDVAKGRAKSISAAWGDFTSDGLLDLFVANEEAPHNLYVNNGDGTFSDRAAVLHITGKEGRPRGVALADFDNDGDVDIFVNARDGCELFVNDIVGEGASSLKVLPRGKEGTIGATVRLYSAEGKLVGLREIGGGESRGSQHEQAALFGVSPGTYVVRVSFTNGTTREEEVRVDVAQKAKVTVNEKSRQAKGPKRKTRAPNVGADSEVF
ncbi:MAG: FG-GAP repeat domain-containing protein, partial [Planctomycetota bacterium]